MYTVLSFSRSQFAFCIGLLISLMSFIDVYVCVRACVRACVSACVSARVRVGVCVRACVRAHAYMCVSILRQIAKKALDTSADFFLIYYIFIIICWLDVNTLYTFSKRVY